jgi:tRNA (guanine37-N1)-methyltransferase
MRFEIISIFPEVFDTYFKTSLFGRACKKGIVQYTLHNLRDYTKDKHRTVDDTPYGGGAGMVMKVEPIYDNVQSILSKDNISTRILLLSAKGRIFTQEDAQRLSHYERIILICGRYEGVDERVNQYIADEEISIGHYVLTGGELPAMIVCDALTRLIPGVLGNPNSLQEESYGDLYDSSYPQYTKPEIFRDWNVPQTLLEGNHHEIKKWRKAHARLKNTVQK